MGTTAPVEIGTPYRPEALFREVHDRAVQQTLLTDGVMDVASTTL